MFQDLITRFIDSIMNMTYRWVNSKNVTRSISTLTTQLDPMSFISSNTSSRRQPPHSHGLTDLQLQKGSRLGIDTHADTSCAGRHVRILEYIDGTKFNVAPFQGPSIKNISLANGIVAIDKEDGQPGYILELNGFLDFTSSLEHSLLCPMQARVNDIQIDDVPKSMSTHSTQSIILTDEARIPIYFHGPIPYIHIRYPTDEDMELYTWIKLTDTATWNPYEKDYNLSSVETSNNEYHFNKPIQYDELYTSILNSVSISGTSSNPKNKCLTPEALSSLWKIPLHIAKHTIKATLF